ncbi:hypothetical protein [Curtobacterium ammoniigenes]|uniref:hypothetical protein n=1 Tax=Curtobacterium ammoniigenes TaxID=395387 RepID=UPI0012ECFF02|nr:hypothetical protein [Curtobacterium ammoniigenes]
MNKRSLSPSTRTALIATILFVACTAAAYLRVTPLARHVLWAEDGRNFVSDANVQGFWASLFTPIGGYQQMLPRLLASLATTVAGPTYLAQTVTLLACLTVGAVSALLFILSRGVLQSPVLRILLAAIPPLIPTAPEESLGTLNNLHSYLLLLSPWLFIFVPKKWWSSIGAAALSALILLSETQAILFMPLLLLGVRRPKKWPMIAGALLGAAIEVATYLGTPRVQYNFGPTHITPWDVVVGYLAVPLAASWTFHLHFIAEVITHVTLLPLIVLAVVMLGLAVVAAIWANSKQRWMIVATTLGSGIIWSAAILVSPAPGFEFAQHTFQDVSGFGVWRYSSVSSGFILAALVLIADTLLQRSLRAPRIIAVAVAVVVALPLVVNWWTPPSQRSQGTPLAVQVAAAKQQCGTGKTTDPQLVEAPPGWTLNLTCAYLSR